MTELTPKELADRLDLSPKRLRAMLRKYHSRPPQQKGSRWAISEDLAKKVEVHYKAKKIAAELIGMAIWDDVISERDKQVYESSGMGTRKAGLGNKPALVIIDVNYNWVGDKPEPILESIKRFPFSCGNRGWKSVYHIADLLKLAREKKVTVAYSTALERRNDLYQGRWLSKSTRSAEAAKISIGSQIVEEIAPRQEDIVIYKTKPSIFFGTPFMSMLNLIGVDTLLFCGGTTSGCVRASVIDAFSYNFRVSVIEECVFDRGEVSHKVNLFDMNAKYADVISVADVKKYFESL